MTDTRRKVKLVCSTNIDMRGDGDQVQLAFSAHRKKASGGYEFFEIELDVGRYVIQRLARQIATMHERDRARLAREMARIEKEIDAIKQPETA
jgi:hypothetical protein